MSTKTALRRSILLERQNLSESDWRQSNQDLNRHLLQWLKGQSFTQLFYYISTKGEADVSGSALRNAKQYRLGLPHIKGARQMDFHEHGEGETLIPNQYGILEPLKEKPILTADARTVILVPCVAVSQDGYRLGYGGGYYDVYLNKHSAAKKLGVAFHRYVLKSLPIDSWDQKLDGVATDQGLTWF